MLLDKAVLVTEPYPHCIIQDALPWDVYNELNRTRFPDKVISKGDNRPNVRVDLPTREAKLTGLWKEFVDRHTGIEFWQDVQRVFGIKVPGTKVGVRKTGDFDIATECQQGINTPCPTRSRVIGPHFDNTREIYAGFLYMPADDDPGGGDFEIRRYTSIPVFHGKSRIPDDCTETVSTVPYRANTFVIFINGPEAVHSVSYRGPCTQYRRLVNVIGEAKQPLFGVRGA